MTTMLETDPGEVDDVDTADPDEDEGRQGDRGPAPEEPVPAEAPEVPADQPTES